MPWLLRQADAHKCKLPVLGQDAQDGDIWRCPMCQALFGAKSSQRNGTYLERVPDELMPEALRRVEAAQDVATRLQTAYEETL